METDSVARASEQAPAPVTLGLVHGLPNDVYHGGQGLSSSGLKDFRRTPWHFHALHHLPRPAWFDASDDDEETTGAMFAGTLGHCAVLEPAEFDQRYAVGPAVARYTKEWKDFVKRETTRQVISPKQYAIAQGQAAALRAIPTVAEILEGGESEVSVYWHDKPTGVLCRARPDCMNRTFGPPGAPAIMLLDVKTTTDASKAAVSQKIARYGYHHQAEWYSRGVAQATGLPVVGFVFAFVESAWPFACSVFELDPEAYEVARRENRSALEQFARCEQTKTWPSFSSEVEYVSLPRWAGGVE